MNEELEGRMQRALDEMRENLRVIRGLAPFPKNLKKSLEVEDQRVERIKTR